jgi:hypothetical protein
VVLASEDKALLANEHAMNQHIDVQRVWNLAVVFWVS